MKVLIAPDSFKGSLSSFEVAQALATGLHDWAHDFDCRLHPLADGGEGSVDAMLAAVGGELKVSTVSDPLGRPVSARWAMLADRKSAVIEMAAASGLPLLTEQERNPLLASTYGTGELICAALDEGASSILIGIGGSATNDGGAGMAQALGYRLLNHQRQEIAPGAVNLQDLARIDASGADRRLASAEIRVACDVTNPLLGERGASRVYGPQKGADRQMLVQLEELLTRFLHITQSSFPTLPFQHGQTEVPTPLQLAEQAGAGAAGGLGFGLLVFAAASLARGIDLVMQFSDFPSQVDQADIIMSGEGKTDRQSLYGKVIMGVAQQAHRARKPLLIFSGSLETGAEQLLEHGATALFSIIDRPMSLAEAIEQTAELLHASAYRSAPMVATLAKVAHS